LGQAAVKEHVSYMSKKESENTTASSSYHQTTSLTSEKEGVEAVHGGFYHYKLCTTRGAATFRPSAAGFGDGYLSKPHLSSLPLALPNHSAVIFFDFILWCFLQGNGSVLREFLPQDVPHLLSEAIGMLPVGWHPVQLVSALFQQAINRQAQGTAFSCH